MSFSGNVNLVQDFTTDRDALGAAVANLTLTDGTAIYDGVMQAAAKMSEVSQSRKLVVLLSDGHRQHQHGRPRRSRSKQRETPASVSSP